MYFHFDRERAVDSSITESQVLACGVMLDLSDPGTHVPPIERPIQTVKNRIRAIKASLPYDVKEPRTRRNCVRHTVSKINKVLRDRFNF